MKLISAIAAIFLLADTSALKMQSRSNLIEQARNMVDVDSEAYTHLSNALYGLPSVGAPAAGAQDSASTEAHS